MKHNETRWLYALGCIQSEIQVDRYYLNINKWCSFFTLKVIYTFLLFVYKQTLLPCHFNNSQSLFYLLYFCSFSFSNFYKLFQASILVIFLANILRAILSFLIFHGLQLLAHMHAHTYTYTHIHTNNSWQTNKKGCQNLVVFRIYICFSV